VTGTGSLEAGRPLFGRPGGPARLALAVAALLALLTLTVTVARLDLRLAEMVRANEATVDGARRIAEADDRFTRRLQQLDTVAAGGRATLEQTRALRPLLTELRDALRPTAAAVATGRAGAEHSAEQLARIRKVLTGLRSASKEVAASTEAFDAQGGELLRILGDLTADLRAAVEAADRIEAVLPPRIGGG
jgi:methyl-accepting chemotaxis protein